MLLYIHHCTVCISSWTKQHNIRRWETKPVADESPTFILSLCRCLFILRLEVVNVCANTRRCSYGGQDGALDEGHSRWKDVAVSCYGVAVCNVIGQQQS